MNERINHVAEALRHAENADDLTQFMPDALQAMIHATLALVEQQRIANLIAVNRYRVNEASPRADRPSWVIEPGIAEALGLS